MATTKYFIIDNCMSKRCFMDFDPVNATDRSDAIDIFAAKWNGLTLIDQRDRDSYELVYAAVTDDGGIDFESVETIARFK